MQMHVYSTPHNDTSGQQVNAHVIGLANWALHDCLRAWWKVRICLWKNSICQLQPSKSRLHYSESLQVGRVKFAKITGIKESDLWLELQGNANLLDPYYALRLERDGDHGSVAAKAYLSSRSSAADLSSLSGHAYLSYVTPSYSKEVIKVFSNFPCESLDNPKVRAILQGVHDPSSAESAARELENLKADYADDPDDQQVRILTLHKKVYIRRLAIRFVSGTSSYPDCFSSLADKGVLLSYDRSSDKTACTVILQQSIQSIGDSSTETSSCTIGWTSADLAYQFINLACGTVRRIYSLCSQKELYCEHCYT